MPKRLPAIFFALLFVGVASGQAADVQGASQTPAPLQVDWQTQKTSLLSVTKAVYPQIAVMAHIEGIVRVQFVVSSDGTTRDLEFESGPPLLMKAAMDSVRTWRFQPTMVDGKAIEVETTAPVHFFLAGADPEKVLAVDREKVQKHPDDAKAHAELAGQLYRMWKLDDSVEEYRRALTLKPDKVEYESGLAEALMNSGNTKTAIDEYRLLLLKKSDDDVAIHALAELLEMSGDVNGAIVEYRRLNDPNWKVEGELRLGQLLMKKGDADGAIKELQTAVRQGSPSAETHYELGNAYLLKNDMNNAEKEYRKASSEAPNNRKYHEALDRIAKETNR